MLTYSLTNCAEGPVVKGPSDWHIDQNLLKSKTGFRIFPAIIY